MRYGLYLAVVMTATICLGQSGQDQTAIHTALSAAKQAVSARTISSVRITHLYPDILTRIMVTPKSLANGSFRIELSDGAVARDEQQLYRALQLTSAQPAKQQDVRWGIVFRGSDQTVLLAAYFSSDCSSGYVNGLAVSYKESGLCQWAKSVSSSLPH